MHMSTGTKNQTDNIVGRIEEEAAKTLFQLVWGAAKSAIGWLAKEHQIRDALSVYICRYYERHGKVKVLGMNEPISLSQLYTEVRLLPSSVLNRYVDTELMKQDFIRQRKHTTDGESDDSVDGIEIANKHRLLTILGAPGSGKSTFLRHLGQCCLLSTGKFRHQRLPVVLALSEHTDCKTSEDLISCIAKEFANCGFSKSDKMVESFLKKGILMILFDGLDEVPKAHLPDVVNAVRNFVDRYGYRPDFKDSKAGRVVRFLSWAKLIKKSEILEADNREANRFVITCRTAHYKQWFSRFTDVVVADFSARQIARFAKNWFRDKHVGPVLNSERFMEELNGLPSAHELARTPLLLTFLCIVWEQGQTLPRIRAILYKDALEVLLRRWAASKLVHNDPVYADLNHELELDMLAQVAHNFTLANQVFFERDSLIREIKQFMEQEVNAPKTLDAGGILEAIAIQQGLLAERAIDVWSFSHLTIQEFLTARHLRASNKWGDAVDHFLFETRWREVFLLMAGIGRSDDLLERMTLRIQTFIKSDSNLLELISWVDGCVSSSLPATALTSDRLALGCLMLAFVVALDRAVIDEDRSLPVALALKIKGDIDYGNAFIPAYDRPTDRARLITSNYPSAIGKVRLMREFNNPRASATQWARKLHMPFEELSRGLCDALWVVIHAIQLIIDSKNASYSLTPSKWDSICVRLLCPEYTPLQD